MAGKVISFGYKQRALTPQADQIVDVRKLSHDLNLPEVDDLIEGIAKDYKVGQNIAIGCEQGKHRSVELAKRLGERLKLRVQHRDE